ncbi:putative TIR domain, AAA+ ATPase domain, P-loop containing nucleoside triphosphate hydrolase [Helianthus annuus]|nr:putative TIR domain, AAA+ ATPase domain, P-loop containing nucleoside triphosphate hydrolase [Helianthus annuus]
MASSSSSRSYKHDVFLSFRGEDTRKTFVDHLYSALVDRQIRTFKDDETFLRGEFISPSLFKAIEESRIAVVIFSKNYANSSWCLEELMHIMKCKDEKELTVIPIFYGVDPSDVRKQRGDFGKAFAQQEEENNNKVQLWRNKLVDASKISGWEPKNIANGHESKAIKEIADRILDRLFSSHSYNDEHLVGLTTRLQELKSRLEIGSSGVLMVGIWGVGGSGKTTLASSLYKEISCHFQSKCIVDNIRVESSKHGLEALQQKILLRVLNTKREVQSVEEGKGMIKNRLCHTNVLLLLDDVSDLEQLEALAGSHNWFGSGSRVIITTRDEHLLKTHKVDWVYPITLLSPDEAMRLFKRHAYNEKNHPVEEFETLSLSVVSYANGLPLALKVLGTFLYDKDKLEWISALDKLKDFPDSKVMDILKISYDGLEPYQKELFLDIACFFRGRFIGVAMEILEACNFYPKIGIKVLRQKALITIVNGMFDMHDLVQEMGQYIVRGKHPKNPEKHSRVWKNEEIRNICFGHAASMKENDNIEALRYKGDSYNHSSRMCKIVSNMKKLRYVDWDGYPASPFPKSFQPTNLVVLKLSFSVQKDLWNDDKHLPHLKVLHLEYMWELLNTPDFAGLPCLQNLTLSSCSKLKEIHPSLGNHTSLKYVSVSCCYKLKMFPTIVHMENLKTLEIKSCPKICEFPEIKANMKSLVKLSLEYIGIEVLPSTIGDHCANLISLYLSYLDRLKSIEFNFDALKHLKELELEGLIQLEKTRRQSFHQLLRSLRKLDLGSCRLKDSDFPITIVDLPNLQVLNLSNNDFSRLDFNISQLTQLKFLNLSRCEKLLELPKLPSSLTTLKASHCKLLTTFGDCHKNCKWLCQVSLFGAGIINDGERLLQSMLEGKPIENDSMVLQLQGLEVAKGFTPRPLRGKRFRLQLPENWCNDFCGFLMCAITNYLDPMVCMRRTMGDMDSQDNVVWKEDDSASKRSLVWYVSFGSLRHTTWWDQTCKAISFQIRDKYDRETTKECSGIAVRLVASKSRSGLTETSTHSSGITPKFMIEDDSSSALVISLVTSTNFTS